MTRQEKRADARRERRAKELAERNARLVAGLPKHPLGDPRNGDDRRHESRRQDPPLTGKALDDRLAELGIRSDRRHNDRRRGTDRRR